MKRISYALALTLTVAALTLVIVSSPRGQSESDKAPAPPPMPAEMSRLSYLVGEWETIATMAFAGQRTTGTVRHVFRQGDDWHGLSIEETGEVPGMPTYRALDIMGFDPNTKLYHIYTVDNYGDCHDHVGSFTDSTHLSLQWKGLSDGKNVIENLVINFTPPTYSFVDVVLAGTDTLQYIAGTMQRKGK